jgi:hypothetical protein
VGGWKANRRHGLGINISAGGDKYGGSWHEGERHG